MSHQGHLEISFLVVGSGPRPPTLTCDLQLPPSENRLHAGMSPPAAAGPSCPPTTWQPLLVARGKQPHPKLSFSSEELLPKTALPDLLPTPSPSGPPRPPSPLPGGGTRRVWSRVPGLCQAPEPAASSMSVVDRAVGSRAGRRGARRTPHSSPACCDL